jgi:hypothetical protein
MKRGFDTYQGFARTRHMSYPSRRPPAWSRANSGKGSHAPRLRCPGSQLFWMILDGPPSVETSRAVACRVKMKRGEVIRPGHIEHFVGTGEGPAQAGLCQLSGDTPAPPRRIHQDAAEAATSRSSRACLLGCQLDDPAMGDYLAAGLGDEHVAQIIGNVRGELLAKVTSLYPKDTHGKLDSRWDVRLRERLDLHRAHHAIGRLRRRTTRIASQHLAD